MHHSGKAIWIGLLMLLVAGSVLAQGAPAISRWNIGGGGGVASGGNVVLHGALGQGIAGPSSGGNVMISAGFWAGGPVRHAVYLPLVVRNLILYALPCGPGNNYCEDNDTWQQAYGPLQPDVEYTAYPDDAEDFYFILLPTAAQVTLSVTNYKASGWLILYNENYTEIGKEPARNNQIIAGPYNLGAGKYYIRIYTSQPYNSTDRYTLIVTQQ